MSDGPTGQRTDEPTDLSSGGHRSNGGVEETVQRAAVAAEPAPADQGVDSVAEDDAAAGDALGQSARATGDLDGPDAPDGSDAPDTTDERAGSERTGGSTAADGTAGAAAATSTSFAERVQARFGRARDEHRESAAAPQQSLDGQTLDGQPPYPPPVRAAPPVSATKSSTAATRKPARRARLRLTRIDPWTVMKTAFLLAIAFGVVTVVSVLMVWSVLGAAGVWESINATVQNVLGEQSTTVFDIEDYLGTRRVIGFTLIIAVVDVILVTAIATLSAFLYNLAAALLGGVEVTLAEEDR